MPRSPKQGRRGAAVVAMLLLALGLALVFGKVMKLRFSSGEIYPHYSSLRSDPLGTRALYDALGAMPGFEVSRNLRPVSRVEGVGPDTTVLLLGVPRVSLAWHFAHDDDHLMNAVENGARLVLAINPGLVPRTGDQAEEQWWSRQRRIRQAHRSADAGKAGDNVIAGDEATLLEVLGAEVVVPEDFERPEGGWELIAGEGVDATPVPEALPDWYSQCRLGKLAPPWSLVASVADSGEPVVVERRFGKGSVVLASGAYFCSNEALWENAPSEFLLWLIGGRSRVIFDESIHGARQSTGVVQWIRRYRLHGIFLGLLVFIGLLAWRSGSSLVPKHGALDRGLTGDDGAVIGEASTSGLVGLLHRSVPPASLLRRCVDLWGDSGSSRAASLARDEEIDRLAEAAADPVQGYREIVATLQRRRR